MKHVFKFPTGPAQAYAAGVGPLPPCPPAIGPPPVGLSQVGMAKLKQLLAIGHEWTPWVLCEINARTGGAIPAFNPIPDPVLLPIASPSMGIGQGMSPPTFQPPGPLTASLRPPPMGPPDPGAQQMVFLLELFPDLWTMEMAGVL